MINELTLSLRKNVSGSRPQISGSLFLATLVCLVLANPKALSADFVPKVGPELKTITVSCDAVTVLFRQNTQWTPGRFDFQGSPMTTERSAYGTVFMFPEIGFIGTGHFENEPEDLKSVNFYIDGKDVKTPAETLTGSTFRFERDSKIRDFRLKNLIEIRNNRIIETTSISTDKAVPLALVYNFMHAWTPTVSEYLAGNDDGSQEVLNELLPGTEETNKKFYINKAVDWIAVYEPKSKQFAVSRLLKSPEEAEAVSKIWNVKNTYRKYYHTSFSKKTVPAGFNGSWKMVTGFGSSSVDDWKSEARKLSQELLKEASPE